VQTQAIKVFVSLEHPCGYYKERVAQNLVLDPIAEPQREIYDSAITRGFRRAGGHVYRPYCAHCHACIASRINIARFQANRAQRRCLKANSDLQIMRQPAKTTQENFALYQRYLRARHAGGGMDEPEPEDFERFLFSTWSQTEFLEFRLNQTLIAVAVTDVTRSGLSAVYSFFDPELAARGLGVFAVLSQIDLARSLQLPFLYLGFWLENHPKMHYKASYSGLEILHAGAWSAYQEFGKKQIESTLYA
jgi:leucyl-tRNA---protein transferase